MRASELRNAPPVQDDVNVKPVAKEKPVRRDLDFTFLFLIILLTSFGLIMLLSASTPVANSKFNNSYYFFIRQLVFAGIGFVAMLLISHVNYNFYKKFALPIMAVCTILLILVAIPGIGTVQNGARRWLGPFQPSELMKPAIAMFFSYLITKEKHDLTKFKTNIPYLVILFILFLLMMAEPHLSGAIVIVGIGITIMIVAGFRLRPLVITGVIASPIVLLYLFLFDKVRWARITSFIDPFHDLQGKSYQVAQSLYAIGSGGIFGKGLGESTQKYSFLPEPYNDFIFSVICEELGLIGAVAVIMLFVMFIYCGIRIALRAPDKFSTLLASGIVAQVAIQFVLNIAVATSTIPCTGVSLPFFSYGGTAIMMLLAELGILLNISRHGVPVKGVFSGLKRKEKS